MDYNFWTFILNNFKINFRRRHYILWILHAKFYLMWPKCVQWQAPRCLAVFSRTFCKLSVNIALVLFSEFWYFGVLGSHLVHCFTVVHLYQTLAFKVRYSWTRGVPDKTSWMRGVPNFDWGPAYQFIPFSWQMGPGYLSLNCTGPGYWSFTVYCIH